MYGYRPIRNLEAVAWGKRPWENIGQVLGEETGMVSFGGAVMDSGQGKKLESGYFAAQQKQTQQHGLVAVGNGSEVQLQGVAHHDIRGIWPMELSVHS